MIMKIWSPDTKTEGYRLVSRCGEVAAIHQIGSSVSAAAR
jgi:hypothetical protein